MDELKERKPFLYIAVGRKGIGKSFTTLDIIKQYCYGKHPKRALIFDVNREFDEIKTLALADVLKFSAHQTKEIRRIVPPFGMSLDDIANMLKEIVYNYREGLLFIEDINRYTSDSLPGDLIGSIVSLRHAGTDVLISYQNIGRAGHPKVCGNLDTLRIHKTTDDATRHKNKFEERYDIIKIAQIIVDNDYDLANMLMYELTESEKENKTGRASGLHGVFCKKDGEYKSMYTYVDFNKNKIYGKFTFDEYMLAIDEYIDDNEKTLLGALRKKKDKEGKLLYDYDQSRKIVRNRLTNEYYGNPDRIKVLKKMK